MLRAPRRRTRDAEVHDPHRHARAVPDATSQESDVPAPRSGRADALRRGVADREVRQLTLVLQALAPPVGVDGQHVDHALGSGSLPPDPRASAERAATTTASPPMTEVSRATRVRVFMPETVRALAAAGLCRDRPVDDGRDDVGCAGESTRGGREHCRDRVNSLRYRVRAAEGSCLENMCGGNSTVGSNPTGTATENPRSRGGFLLLRRVLGASLVHSPERTTPRRACLLLGSGVSHGASDRCARPTRLFLECAQRSASLHVGLTGPRHRVAPLKL